MVAGNVFCVQKSFDISRCGIRSIELRKWRSDEKEIFQRFSFLQIYLNLSDLSNEFFSTTKATKEILWKKIFKSSKKVSEHKISEVLNN